MPLLFSKQGPTFNGRQYGLNFINGLADAEWSQVGFFERLGGYGHYQGPVVSGSEVVWEVVNGEWIPSFLAPKNSLAAVKELPPLDIDWDSLPSVLPDSYKKLFSFYNRAGNKK